MWGRLVVSESSLLIHRLNQIFLGHLSLQLKRKWDAAMKKKDKSVTGSWPLDNNLISSEVKNSCHPNLKVMERSVSLCSAYVSEDVNSICFLRKPYQIQNIFFFYLNCKKWGKENFMAYCSWENILEKKRVNLPERSGREGNVIWLAEKQLWLESHVHEQVRVTGCVCFTKSLLL